MNPVAKRKPGRPKGRVYRRGIAVCLTPESYQALEAARTLFGFSLGKMIRAGVDRALAEVVPKAMSMLGDPKTSGSRSLILLEFLRLAKLHAASESSQGRRLREELDTILEEQRQRRPHALRTIVQKPRISTPSRRRGTAPGREFSPESPIPKQNGYDN